MVKAMRERILAEALVELNLHGAEFHMDNLARRLRISKRTLYQHFSSKQEIVQEAIISVMNDVYKQHVAMLHDSSMTPEEKIMGFFAVRSRHEKLIKVFSVRKMSDVFLKMPEICNNLEACYERDWTILDHFLDEAQQSHEFKEFDKPLLMHMLHSAAEDVLDYINEVNKDYSFQEYMNKCLAMILYGIKR